MYDDIVWMRHVETSKFEIKNQNMQLNIKGNWIEEIIGDDTNCMRFTCLPSYEMFNALPEYLLNQAEYNFNRFSSERNAGSKRKKKENSTRSCYWLKQDSRLFLVRFGESVKIGEKQMSKILSEGLNILFLELKCLF